MGGILAFLLAQEVSDRVNSGSTVALKHLILSSTPSPQYPADDYYDTPKELENATNPLYTDRLILNSLLTLVKERDRSIKTFSADLCVSIIQAKQDEFLPPRNGLEWCQHDFDDIRFHKWEGIHDYYLQPQGRKKILDLLNTLLKVPTSFSRESSFLYSTTPPMKQQLMKSDISWEEKLKWFVQLWRDKPYRIRGACTVRHLAWICGVSKKSEEGEDEPEFGEQLMKAVARYIRNDAHICVPKAISPIVNAAAELSFLNTLLRWSDWLSKQLSKDEISNLVVQGFDNVIRELECYQQQQGYLSMHGDTFRYTGFPAKYVILNGECRLLFQQLEATTTVRSAISHLNQHLVKHGRKKSLLQSFMQNDISFTKHYGVGAVKKALLSDHPVGLNNLAEYTFSDIEVVSQDTRDYVKRVHPRIPGCSAAFASRFYELTRDSNTLSLLRELMKRPRDGLTPDLFLMECIFGVYYLILAGVDVNSVCPDIVNVVVSAITTTGTSIDGYLVNHSPQDGKKLGDIVISLFLCVATS